MDRTFTRVMLVVVAALAIFTTAALGFLGGVVVTRTTGGEIPAAIANLPVTPKTTDAGALVDEVQKIIKNEALVPPGETTMTTGAVQGLLNSIEDSYAVYFDPSAYTKFQEDQTGQFFGIGITVQLNDKGQPFVVKPFPGTPAAKAGLKANDVIVSINGEKRAKWDIDQVVARIRGPKGTKVTLEISRKGTPKTFKVQITRDKITVPNVMSRKIGKDVGYIRLMQFTTQADQQVRDAINSLAKQGVKGYILDLRENPGGLLQQAVDVSSLFVKDGVIVRVDERGKPEQEEFATGDTATTKPLVLLVDGNSASASEIVAAALKDYGRAKLVGEKTFGKGSVQTIEQLSNGGAVKLTTAHYLSPKKIVINKVGVTPDYVVKMDMKNQAKDSTDTQLQKAIAVLRGML
jgi:carboxyl-terminal processing protease